MLSEKAICELLSSLLPEGRLNRCYESDAEIININGGQCLFTTDEFSAEDLLREDDAYALGWNIAAGAISDILACGGVPLYYAHALTLNPQWDAGFIGRFGSGIREVLKATGARFIGGDFGRSEVWRCTVSVIGACEGQPVLRRGAKPGDFIYLSGTIGAGNLEAALRLQERQGIRSAAVNNRFPLRLAESALMKKYASCCMDTSDGVCAALNTLADLNGCGYAIADLPYQETALRFCEQAGLPPVFLFLGECGEYELLFTVPAERQPAFERETREAGCAFHCLGRMAAAGRRLHEGGRIIDAGSWRAQARDFAQVQQYIAALARWLEEQKASPAKAGAGGGR